MQCYLQTRQPQNDKTLGHNGHHEDVVDRLMNRAHGRNVFGPRGGVGATTVGRSGCCCCCLWFLTLDAVDRLTVCLLAVVWCVCIVYGFCSDGRVKQQSPNPGYCDGADTAMRVSKMEAGTSWIRIHTKHTQHTNKAQQYSFFLSFFFTRNAKAHAINIMRSYVNTLTHTGDIGGGEGDRALATAFATRMRVQSICAHRPGGPAARHNRATGRERQLFVLRLRRRVSAAITRNLALRASEPCRIPCALGLEKLRHLHARTKSATNKQQI